jgi:hypothetical protein
MYGWIDQEASRQYREEIRNEVAINRLAKMARANRVRKSRLIRDLRWELARYGERLGKRLRNTR